MRKLQTLALTTFLVIGLILMRLNRYRPSTLIRHVCVFFFQPLSRVFLSRCVIGETLGILVWTEGLKSIEMKVFSNESALVCTGPNLWSTRKRHPWNTQGQSVILTENMFSFATNPVHTIPCIARIHARGKT